LTNLTYEPSTDPKVKRKILAVLASWNHQFKSDPSMTLVAGLFHQCRVGEPAMDTVVWDATGIGEPPEVTKRRLEKEEAKRLKQKEKEKKEAAKKKKQKEPNVMRARFNFEKVGRQSSFLP
jgi:LAS seventeen-binding protein 5